MEIENKHSKRPTGSNNQIFRVPDGYFDQLPQQVMDKIEMGDHRNKESVIIRYIKPIIGLAASFALILGLVYVPLKMFSPTNESNSNKARLNEEYFITSEMDDHNIFEMLENAAPEETFNNQQLENVLICSVDEYELIVLNNK
jgi:hypothetical protein